MERSISTSRPATNFPPTDLTLPAVQAAGKLTWRTVLAWLREDKILSAEDVEPHRASLRRRQQRPASAGADRQRRPHPHRRRQGARRRDADRVAGQAEQAALRPHRPAQGRRRPRRRRDVDQLCRAAPCAAAQLRHQRRDDRDLRAARHRLGLGDRVAHQAARPPGDRQSGRDRPLHHRVLRALALGAQRHEDGRELGARQLRAAGRARQELEAARRQRLRRHPGRRLALAVRLRPARLRHPPRAAARAQRHPLPHRRRDAHRLPAAAGRDERDDRARQAARADGRGRKAPSARRPHQGPQHARRRGRDAPVDHPHRLRREDGDADLRSRHHRQDAREPGLRQPRRQALGRAGVAGRTASSWSPAPPARARRPRSTRRCGAWPPTRSTSARSRIRSR